MGHLSQLVQAGLDNKDTPPRRGRILCYINYTIESFKIADNLVILPIVNCCRPMLQYSHDENNKQSQTTTTRKSRKAGRKTTYEKAAEPEEHERNYCELFR